MPPYDKELDHSAISQAAGRVAPTSASLLHVRPSMSTDITDPPPAPDPLETPRGADGYNAPVAKSINELLSAEGKDGEDDALQRYKASLLGAAAAGGGVKTGDVRRVIIKEISVIFNTDSHPPITFDLTNEALLAGGINFTLKEGCEYRMRLSFIVQNEIVSGLTYKNVVTRGPLPSVKTKEMLGSYGPDPSKVNVVEFPRREWDEAPSGMMLRGTYGAKTTFVDDDGKEHLNFSYKFNIAKDWAE